MSLVRDAIATRRLRLAYQPVVLTRDTGRIAFHEGLMRVLEPSGRIIPAREFMEAIEDTELGRQVDCAALEMPKRTLERCLLFFNQNRIFSCNHNRKSWNWKKSTAGAKF